MPAVSSEECSFQQNMNQRGSFNDRVQQGKISFVTCSGLEMKEIRQEFSEVGNKTPSCLSLVFVISK